MPNELSVQSYSLSRRYMALNGVPAMEMLEPQQSIGNLQDATELQSLSGWAGMLDASFQAAHFAGGSQNNTNREPRFQGRVSGPIRSLLSIFARWEISDQDAAKLLGKETAQYLADLRAGTAGLTGRDTQDRARLLLEIYEAVHSLLREAAEEKSWLTAAMPALEGRNLFEIMHNGSIADLLLTKSFADHANGR
ncbi:hypothetical protein [Bradyrhizobium sp.]|uniref:hypothetical protein n=1 Tax=Bradyrhizobium sp. TaxID=376 RepID=UPI003C47AC17